MQLEAIESAVNSIVTTTVTTTQPLVLELAEMRYSYARFSDVMIVLLFIGLAVIISSASVVCSYFTNK